MTIDPSLTAEAIRFTCHRPDDRLQATSGRSHPC
jgi:hypothetical protein